MSDTISVEKNCAACGVVFTDTMIKLLGHFPISVADFKRSPMLCQECKTQQEEKRRLAQRRRWLGFDHDSIKAHWTQNPPQTGDIAILWMTQHHTNRYRLVRVIEGVSGPQKRIIIDKGDAWGGASYHRSGKSGIHAKGQTKLLPYVEAVAARLNFERDTELNDAELALLLPDVGCAHQA